ncbi:MAG: PepSY domain-containing protein [Clostridiales bacterium]|nr:PepSY domain-containing protein [Clostridiales bacterium]
MSYNQWSNGLISLEEAIQIALQEVPGRAVKAELESKNGLLIYEVDIVSDYGDYEVRVDASTGNVIRVEYD